MNWDMVLGIGIGILAGALLMYFAMMLMINRIIGSQKEEDPADWWKNGKTYEFDDEE